MKRVSIRKVSELAGVSVSSASLVFNGRHGKIPLSSDTISRVLEAARQLDYRPNRQAQNLRCGNSASGTIGIVVSSLAMRGGLNQRVLTGICTYAAGRDYQCLLALHDDQGNPELTQTSFISDKMVDGVIAIGFEQQELASVQRILHTRVPLTCVHVQIDQNHDLLSYVKSDDREGGRMAARYLIEHGHRQLAFLGGTPDGDAALCRLAGVREVAAAASLPEVPVIFGDYQSVPSEEVLRLLHSPQAPTALVACSDLIAAQMLSLLPVWNYPVPEKISVIGYDDEPISQYLRPSLTTIRQDGEAEGRMAARMLLDIIERKPEAEHVITLKPQLIERGSVSLCISYQKEGEK